MQQTLRQVAVDATCWGNSRGYGRHARGLLRSLIRLDGRSRYTLFLDYPLNASEFPPEAELVKVNCSAPAMMAASWNGHRSTSDLWRFSRAMSDPRFDLLLFPTIYSYVPVFSRAKKVVFIHDVIAESFPKLTVPGLTSQLFWKLKLLLGRWQADAIATVSDYSRRGIAQRFKIPSDRISIVGEASEPIFQVLRQPSPTPALRSLGVSGNMRYLVYVGGFGPHKNLTTLISVFAKIIQNSQFRDLYLIMVGDYKNEVFHTEYRAIQQRVADTGLEDRVIFAGFLMDDDLVVLLNRAIALVIPSLMEGFGLPGIEAAACGCPVIATNASPLPDLLGEGGEYFEPTKPEELERAIINLLGSQSLRDRRSRCAIQAAGSFTWDAAGMQLLNIFERLFESPS